MKTVLLTGATGFLGSHLARYMVSKGYKVAIFKRSSSDVHRIVDLLGVLSAYDSDTGDLTRPFEELGRIDAIVHTATCYGRHGESAVEIFDANTVFPLHVLELAIRNKVETFINTDTALDNDVNTYALSKRQFAEWGKHLSKAGRIRFLNLKVEHFYGPLDDPSKFTTHVVRSCLDNVPTLKLTAGEQQRDFIYIDDVVLAYGSLLKHSERLTKGFVEYGVGSGQAIRVRDFVETVHRLTSSCTRLEFGAIPYRANEVMYCCTDTSELRALGWAPCIDLAEGIRMTIEREKGLQ